MLKKFIINKFVKNPDDTGNAVTRESYGSVAGFVGIISNAILCTFKILVGLIFNSISILADGINNLADASVSLITLFGFKLAGKKPDEDHPYGHGRTEYLTGLVISVMVCIVGAGLLKSSIEKTIHPEALEYSYLSMLVLVIAIAIKLWQTGFNMEIGKRINSAALLATGQDSRNDVISTSAVLLATIIGRFTSLNLDGPAGIVVALFILWGGKDMVIEAIAPIIGNSPDPELVSAIKKIVIAPEHVYGVHDLIIHDYGPGRLFASCHAEVYHKVDIFELHDMIDNLEKEVADKLNVHLVIHMDPVDPFDPLTIQAKDDLVEIARETEWLVGVHDVRVVHGETHHNVVFDAVIKFDCPLDDAAIREYLETELKKYNPKFVSVVSLDHKYA